MRDFLRNISTDTRLIFLAGIILLWVSLNINGKKDYATGLIESDAKGYYAWLPAVFIYQDLNFGFYKQIEQETYYNPFLIYEYRATHQGKTINKYYAGTALCLAPFFLVGHLLSLASDYPADGFSLYYVKAVSYAGIFYSLLSLLLISRILKLLKIRAFARSLVLLALLFGSNWFYYSLIEFGLSHVYSLAFISLLVYSILSFAEKKRGVYLVLAGFSLGLITLIRPVNLMIIMAIPFILGNGPRLEQFIQQAWKRPWLCLASLFTLLFLISIQAVLYKVQTGEFFVYTYKGEGFDFSRPHMVDILFSYKKGLFLYTPLYLLSLGGLYYLWKEQRERFWFWWLFFIPLVYVFSSWHNWYYGGSLSGRVFVEYLALFGMLLAFLIGKAKPGFTKAVVVVLVVSLSLLCQVQTYQYRHGHIHWSDQNKEKYWEYFLRVDKL